MSVSWIVRFITLCSLSCWWIAGVYGYLLQYIVYDKSKFLSLFVFCFWWMMTKSHQSSCISCCLISRLVLLCVLVSVLFVFLIINGFWYLILLSQNVIIFIYFSMWSLQQIQVVNSSYLRLTCLADLVIKRSLVPRFMNWTYGLTLVCGQSCLDHNFVYGLFAVNGKIRTTDCTVSFC